MNQMPQEIIELVAKAGFDVYMRNETDTWLLFVKGVNIGSLQMARFGGYDISSVHIPNTTTGTGFALVQGLSEEGLTAENLAQAFVWAPSWADSRARGSVQKFQSFAAFQKSNRFNSEYKLVAKAQA